jgi:hypothetical protein
VKRSLSLATVLALVVAPPGAAKWLDKATVTGPGLDAPIVAGEELFDPTGFYAATVGQWPDRMLETPPTRQLGPKYTIVYTLPGPAAGGVLQDLYPYAVGGAVTYTKPGQLFFDEERTRGGWYVAPLELKETLVALGLPRAAPTTSHRSAPHIWMLVPLGVVLFSALPLVAARRRA